jgi:hypothetical protein
VFHNIYTYNAKVIEYSMILLLKFQEYQTKFLKVIEAYSWYCQKAFNEQGFMKSDFIIFTFKV